MKRGSIPALDMHRYGPERLREQGVLVLSHEISWRIEPVRLRPHYHDFFQMLLLVGPCTFMHDFREYDLEGTALGFISPGQVHNVIPGPGMYGTQVSFTQSFVDHNAPPPSVLFDLPFFIPSEAPPCLTIPAGDEFRILEVIRDLQGEFDASLQGAAGAMRALLGLLFIRVNRLYTQVHPTKEISRAGHTVREFKLAVERHFHELHAVSEYAKLLKITPNHLNDVIREQTGHSAGEIIRERRLLNAKRLLLHSDFSVSEIGYQMGFDDPSYFTRFFRRYAGETPAAFRSEIREKYQGNGA